MITDNKPFMIPNTNNIDLWDIPFSFFLFLFYSFFANDVIMRRYMVTDCYSFLLSFVTIIQKKNKMDNKKE